MQEHPVSVDLSLLGGAPPARPARPLLETPPGCAKKGRVATPPARRARGLAAAAAAGARGGAGAPWTARPSHAPLGLGASRSAPRQPPTVEVKKQEDPAVGLAGVCMVVVVVVLLLLLLLQLLVVLPGVLPLALVGFVLLGPAAAHGVRRRPLPRQVAGWAGTPWRPMTSLLVHDLCGSVDRGRVPRACVRASRSRSARAASARSAASQQQGVRTAACWAKWLHYSSEKLWQSITHLALL